MLDEITPNVTFRLAAMGLTSAFGAGLQTALTALRDSEQHALRRHDGFFNAGFEQQTLALPKGRDPENDTLRFPDLLAEAIDDLMTQHAAPLEPLHLVMLSPEGAEGMSAYLQMAAERVSSVWPVATTSVHDAGGAPGLADWLAHAAPPLAQRGMSVIVLAVDSLCTPARLRSLDTQNKLFSRRMPWGLIPGEGAAALLLLSDSQPGLRFLRAATALEAVVEFSDEDTDFAAMSHAAGNVLGDAPRLWVSDWNNSRYRASQLAHAILRVGGNATVLHPAARFGDCGAVFGPLAIVSALAHPDYAMDPVVISASNGTGLCGCFSFAFVLAP